MKLYVKLISQLRSFFSLAGLVFLSLILLPSCTIQESKDLLSGDGGFSPEVASIIGSKCVSCHAGGNSSGGFGFIDDSQAIISSGLIIPGDAGASVFYAKMTASPPYGSRMPSGGPFLSDSELAVIADWINGMGSQTPTTKPNVTLASSSSGTTSASPISFTATFEHSVTGFEANDILATNGTVGNFAGSGAAYTFDVTPSGQGSVLVDIPADVAVNLGGLGNFAATQFSIVYDSVVPSLILSSTAGDPTNVSPITVSAVFSEQVFGFDVTDIVVTNGSAGNFSGSGSGYSFDVTPSGQGIVTISVAAGVAQDAAGNQNSGPNSISRTFDSVKPTLTLSSTAPTSTNTSPIPITATFSGSVTGFVAGDISVGNGSVSGFAGSGTTYTFNVTPSGQGTVTIDVPADVAQDDAGNTNFAATQLTRIYDSVVPSVTLASSASDPTNSSPFAVTATFSESVTGFVSGEVTLSNGSISGFAGSGTTYTFNVTPSGQGAVTVNVAGSVAQDAAGNNNSAATQLSRTFDSVAPTLALTSTAAEPTNTSPIPFVATFSESMTGFTESDISVVNGSVGNFAGSGTTYTFDVTPTAQGVVTVNVAAGVAQDAAGNSNPSLETISRTFSSVKPTVALSSGVSGSTNTSPIALTATFSAAVTLFVSGDVVLGNGNISGFAGSGTTYTFNVTPVAQGNVTVDVPADVAQDGATNTNFAATQFAVIYDSVAPTVSISSTASNPTNVSPIPVTVTFSEAVTGFASNEVSITNGSLSGFAGSGTTYTFNVTPTGEGTVSVDVAGSVAQDAAGNNNSAATQYSTVYDSVAPTVTITSTASNPTKNSPLPMTATFSSSVTGFTSGEISVTNGTVSNFAGSGTTYTFDVTPSGQGALTVNIGAGVAQDSAGNNNTAATQYSNTYDSVAPTVSITSTSSGTTQVPIIPITVTFSESVTGFISTDVTFSNGSISSFAGSGSSYTFNVTATASGTVTVDVAGSVAADSATNNNTAATQFSITYTPVSFATDITPLLKNAIGTSAACLSCHSGGGGSGGYSMGPNSTTLVYSSVMDNVTAYDPSASKLYKKTTSTPGTGSRMPDNGPDYLSSAQQLLICNWIMAGAPNN